MERSDSNQENDLSPDQRIREAEAVLFHRTDITDPMTNEVTRRRVETPLYQQYLDLQAAYIDARATYSQAFEEAHKTSSGRGSWPLIAGTLQLPVKQAYERWRAAGANDVEQAIAVLRSLENG